MVLNKVHDEVEAVGMAVLPFFTLGDDPVGGWAIGQFGEDGKEYPFGKVSGYEGNKSDKFH
jgi:hypothetical protein